MHPPSQNFADRLRYRDTAKSSGNGVIFVLGLPRSGTSWLAKIFDSHPDVIYRHEPDISDREDQLPSFVPADEMEPYLRRTREYLDRLIGARTLKAAGPLPVFPKRHRSVLARVVRTGLILSLRGAELATGRNKWLRRIPIPDLIPARHRRELRVVIKSVNSASRARLFAEACPDSRIVIIIRHPCGQVASFMRGIELGKFPGPDPLTDISRSPEAERLGLMIEHLSRLSVAERLAWVWAFNNQKLIDDLRGMSRVKIVRYEDLAAMPIRMAQEIFAFAGLSWDLQTEMFIKNSTTVGNPHRYYSIIRNSLDAANKWRNVLSVEDQNRILAIARRVAVGRSFAALSGGDPDGAEKTLALSTHQICNP